MIVIFINNIIIDLIISLLIEILILVVSNPLFVFDFVTGLLA